MLRIFNRNFLFTSFFFIYPLIIALTIPIRSADLGVWTAMGMASIKAGAIVTQDTFSLLPTKTVIYPSWGISLVYGAINLLASEKGISWLSLFHKLILLGFLLRVYFKYLRPLQNKWHLKNCIYILFFIYGGNILFSNRPSFVAILPALFTFEIIHENFKISSRNIAKLFLITVFWINVHASAMLVIIMLAWKIVTSFLIKKIKRVQLVDLKSHFLALIFSIGALLVNPFGFKIFPYALDTARISRQRNFLEWLSPFHFDDSFHSILFFVWIGLILFKCYQEIKKSRFEIFISPYILLCFLGLFSIRDTVWSYYFMFALMIEEGTEPNNERSDGNFLNLLFVLFLLLILISLNPFKRPSFLNSINNYRYSLEESIPELETQIILSSKNKGPIFDVESSGYLQLRGVPNKTFLDARNIIFPDYAFVQSDQVLGGQVGWEQVLQEYKIQFLLLDKNYVNPLLIEKIRQSNNWKVHSSRVNYFLAERIY